MSRMFDKGAGGMSDVEIARKLDNMGGSLNGFSGNDSFGFYASFFSRHSHDGLELLSKLYTDPTFPQDKVDRERELIMAAIKSEPDEPTQYVVNILNKTLFPDFPYGFDKLGTPATIAACSLDDLRRTYQRFAVPSNTVITAVGKMDPQKLLEQVEKLFGGLPPKALEMPEIPAERPLDKVRLELVHIPRAKAHLAVGFRGTTLTDPDRCPLDVLNEVLAGQGGRLFIQLRDREALAYVVTSFVRPGLNPGLFGFYLACETSKADRAYEGLIKQIGLIKETKIGDAELKKAINNLIGNHLISLQSSADRAESIGLYTLYGLGYDYESKYLAKVREVTADDVLRVARKYLDLEHCAIVKILPEVEEKAK
jgi:zinc protease